MLILIIIFSINFILSTIAFGCVACQHDPHRDKGTTCGYCAIQILNVVVEQTLKLSVKGTDYSSGCEIELPVILSAYVTTFSSFCVLVMAHSWVIFK